MRSASPDNPYHMSKKHLRNSNFHTNQYQTLTKYLAELIASILVLTFLFACNGKKTESLIQEQSIFSQNDSVFKDVFLNDASKHIRIVPTMNSNFIDSNTVHCANIEYLWNSLISNSDKSVSSNILAKEFSQSSSWRNSMDTSKLVLAFGKPRDVYENVIGQYLTKYKIKKSDLSPQGDTFWGYTDKIVNYKYSEPFDEQKLLFLGTEVSAFGFNSGFSSTYIKDHFKEQFDILYFDYDGKFVVKLNPVNTTDQIILVMTDKQDTFLKLFNESEKLIKRGIEKTKENSLFYNLNAEDELIIPTIRFKALRNYSGLQGLEFSSNYGPIGFFEQVINFSFDRKGVVLEAEVSMADSVGMPQKPKMLHFNKPFYLYIKEANASHPYFSLWVSDTEILERKLNTPPN
jgi:hypothetical protein